MNIHRLLHHYTHITATVNTDLGSTCYTFFLMVLTLFLTWFYRFRSSSWDVKKQHFSALLYKYNNKKQRFFNHCFLNVVNFIGTCAQRCHLFMTSVLVLRLWSGVYQLITMEPEYLHNVFTVVTGYQVAHHIGYPLSTALHALSLTLNMWYATW